MARPIITLSGRGLWPKELGKKSGGVTLEVAKIDIDKVIENLKIVGETVTYNAARAVAESLVAILAYAQPRVPYYPGGALGKASTGELRESGEAVLYLGGIQKVVAKGNIDGTITANMTGITKSGLKKKVSWVSGEVFYMRIEDGLDIALWTHEDLLPYDQRDAKGVYEAAARSPGTGPKYLEIAFLQNKKEIINAIKSAVELTPDKLMAKSKAEGAVGKYAVSRVDLVMKESSRSYFKGISVKRV